MKKAILTGMVLVLMLFLLPSCTTGVSQEEYQEVTSDLAAAQTQIESLQGDLTEAQAQIQSLQSNEEVIEGKRAEALVYAEYLDMILYPVWKEAGIAPRFDFEDELEWLLGLRDRASEMEDESLSNYVEELIEGSEGAMDQLWNYCLERIEQALE